MRLEKIGIGSQPLQQSGRMHQSNSPLQKQTKSHDGSELEEMINKDEVKIDVSKINGSLDPNRTNLKFELHEELNEYYVTVVNPLTNETLKEIPPKKMLDKYAEMIGFMGILIDEQR